MKSKVGIGVIGAGGRSKGVVGKLLGASTLLELVSVYDPDPARSEDFKSSLRVPDTRQEQCYQEMLSNPKIGWIMVFSPNCYHMEHILASFAAGKNVFSEKPLATKIEDCQTICDAHKSSGLIFATGFVLRYAPIYRKAKEILSSGKLGKILSIAANENIATDHGAYIMKNWRRNAKFAGSHILEKCCHDLDLMNWFTDSLPSKAASFGGIGLFVPENASLPEKFSDAGRKSFMGWDDPAGEPCPFKSDKDIIDHQTAAMLYRSGVSGTFQATLSNAIPERRIYFSCTEGTMITELYSQSLVYCRIGEKRETLSFQGDLHGGGDAILARELAASMLEGKETASGGQEGLRSSVLAIAIDESRLSGKVYDIEPVWKKLGV